MWTKVNLSLLEPHLSSILSDTQNWLDTKSCLSFCLFVDVWSSWGPQMTTVYFWSIIFSCYLYLVKLHFRGWVLLPFFYELILLSFQWFLINDTALNVCGRIAGSTTIACPVPFLCLWQIFRHCKFCKSILNVETSIFSFSFSFLECHNLLESHRGMFVMGNAGTCPTTN